MDEIRVRPAGALQGSLRVPGDKSISHRALLFGALAEGETRVRGLLESEDVRSTAACLRALGTQIRPEGDDIVVTGRGGRGFEKPRGPLDCGNSGTTIRLLMGILSGHPLEVELFGDASLSRRPMKRVAEPLRRMGARFEMTNENFPPIHLHGGALQGIEYELAVASAQIKSAVLLAGLHAQGSTRITGRVDSRDHTERLLPAFGVEVGQGKGWVAIEGGQRMRATTVNVPGDPSSAAFWLAAASLVPGSNVRIENVCLNPTRTGFIEALRRMGATIEERILEESPEPVGILQVSASRLHGTKIGDDEVPSLIDELPLVAVLGAFAKGKTEVSGAEELRVKESDRIKAVARNLRAMGGEIEERPDGFVIEGPQKLRGARIEPEGDHRIAMAFAIAGLMAEGETVISDAACAAVSYPRFFEELARLQR